MEEKMDIGHESETRKGACVATGYIPGTTTILGRRISSTVVPAMLIVMAYLISIQIG